MSQDFDYNRAIKEIPMTKTRASLIIGAILIIGALLMAGCPQYSVYLSKKRGEAALAHATYSKEVAVAEAKAKMESATYNAQADTIRAHGIARSNAIIGESLKDNDEYLHWLYIDQIKEAAVSGNLIYLPTEGGMPVMEAGRAVHRYTDTMPNSAGRITMQKIK